jgi:hypothetical protein
MLICGSFTFPPEVVGQFELEDKAKDAGHQRSQSSSEDKGGKNRTWSVMSIVSLRPVACDILGVRRAAREHADDREYDYSRSKNPPTPSPLHGSCSCRCGFRAGISAFDIVRACRVSRPHPQPASRYRQSPTAGVSDVAIATIACANWLGSRGRFRFFHTQMLSRESRMGKDWKFQTDPLPKFHSPLTSRPNAPPP